jgi:glycerol-3-phosphate dehydrogenase (NAD(P)+)
VSNIAVIGGGAWGTAIAIALGRKGTHTVRLWAYEKEVVESVNTRHTNDLFLAGETIPEAIRATSSLPEALSGAEFVVSVMPSHHARRVFQQMKP